MKTTKAEVQNKTSKKAEKKELQKNLSNKFFEAVKSLGHDAENIAEDLVLVSKFLAKKIGKKVSSTKKAAAKKAEVATEATEVIKKVKAKATGKDGKKAPKGSKAAQVLNNAQVTGIASEEKLAQVLPKPAASTKSTTKKPKKPIAKASPTKATTRKTGTDAE
jgi:hypothetical protein